MAAGWGLRAKLRGKVSGREACQWGFSSELASGLSRLARRADKLVICGLHKNPVGTGYWIRVIIVEW